MSAEITLYVKTHCPFCRRAKNLLSEKGVTAWTEYDLETTPEKLDEMTARTNGRRSVPQIFINDKHIGGSDDLIALNDAGKLDALLSV